MFQLQASYIPTREKRGNKTQNSLDDKGDKAYDKEKGKFDKRLMNNSSESQSECLKINRLNMSRECNVKVIPNVLHLLEFGRVRCNLI